MLNIPGCLPGRGSQTEKGGHLWDCALERCSPDTRSVSLSYAPGGRRININKNFKSCTLLIPVRSFSFWFYYLQAGPTVKSHPEQHH